MEKKPTMQEPEQLDMVVPVTVRPNLVYPFVKKKKKAPDAFLRCCWKKGQSGNPKGGHKKRLAIKTVLESIGDETIDVRDRDNKIVKMTRREFVLRQAYLAAEAGDKDFLLFIAERTDGKLPSNVNLITPKSDIVFQIQNKDQQKKIENLNKSADEI
jgi:hypothetical protein